MLKAKLTTNMIALGTQFYRYSWKVKKLETVIDVYTTTNSKGEIVHIRYVCEHEFMGQKVLDRDVNETTIKRSLMTAN